MTLLAGVNQCFFKQGTDNLRFNFPAHYAP